MAISFMCPECGSVFRVPDEFAGRKARCPECQAKFKVPRGLPKHLIDPEDGDASVAAGSAPAGATAAAAGAGDVTVAMDAQGNPVHAGTPAAPKAGDTDPDRRKRSVNLLGLVGALALIAGAFLPIFAYPVDSTTTVQVATYTLPNETEAVGVAYREGVTAAPELLWLWGLLVIPALGAWALLREFWAKAGKRAGNPRFTYFLAAISPLLAGGVVAAVAMQGNLDIAAGNTLLGQVLAALNSASDNDPSKLSMLEKASEIAGALKPYLGLGSWIIGVGALLCLIASLFAPGRKPVEDDDKVVTASSASV